MKQGMPVPSCQDHRQQVLFFGFILYFFLFFFRFSERVFTHIKFVGSMAWASSHPPSVLQCYQIRVLQNSESNGAKCELDYWLCWIGGKGKHLFFLLKSQAWDILLCLLTQSMVGRNTGRARIQTMPNMPSVPRYRQLWEGQRQQAGLYIKTDSNRTPATGNMELLDQHSSSHEEMPEKGE